MKLQWRLLLLAFAYFTRIPVSIPPDYQASDLSLSAKYLPLIGIFVGCAAALVYLLTAAFFPPDIAVIISMAATIYLTGCFHEDGLADAIDGLGGGWNREQILTIMRDSRIGSYGATALVLVLLLKFAALSHIESAVLPRILIIGHGLSRYAALWVMMALPYVRDEGKAKPLASPLSRLDLWQASGFGLVPLLLLPAYGLGAVLPVIIIWLVFAAKLKSRIGGYTGDCLGAMQQLTEVGFYLGVLAWSRS